MAQLAEAMAVVKISKLVKDGEAVKEMLDDDTIAQLEAVLEELINDPKAMVEIIKS
jgi:hypothetical protein